MRTSKAAIVALAMIAVCLPATAGSHMEKYDVTTHGDLRMRYDHVEDYDFDSNTDDNGGAWLYRTMFGLSGQFADGVGVRVDLQAFGDLGNQFGTQNALGGYTYNTGSTGGDIDLYQGYIALEELHGSDWNLYVGRGEVSVGNELHFGDNDFGNGRTFDGARLMGDMGSWDLDVMFMNVNETNTLNFDGGPGAAGDDDSWILAAFAGFAAGDGTITPYIINWRNDADGDGTLSLFANRIDLQTFGLLWENDHVGDDFDASVEFAIQSGDLGVDGATQQSFGGNVIEAELGWSQNDDRRIFLNYLQASGDDNPGDLDFDSFVGIAPELSGARLGYTDNTAIGLSNIRDISLGYECSFGSEGMHGFEARLHMLSLVEDFGGEDELGQELDLVYRYQYAKNTKFELGLANLFAGDALGADPDDAMRAWGGLNVTWGKK